MDLLADILKGAAVLVIGWIAFGTRWIVKLGNRVNKLEDAAAASIKDRGEIREIFDKFAKNNEDEHKKTQDEISEFKENTEDHFKLQDESTIEMGEGMEALLNHFKLKRGLISGDED